MPASLQGELVSLRPATLADRRSIYEWMAESDITHLMLGPPLFPDVEASDWEEFLEDYLPHFFDGSAPEKGRCFLIEREGEAIGQVNYNDVYGKATELDIWLKSAAVLGKGYGTDAVRTLIGYLREQMGLTEFRIAPSERNPAAVRSYEKVGFRRAAAWEGFVPDYHDAVPMVLRVGD